MLALSSADVPERTEGRQPKGHSVVHLSGRAGNGATAGSAPHPAPPEGAGTCHTVRTEPRRFLRISSRPRPHENNLKGPVHHPDPRPPGGACLGRAAAVWRAGPAPVFTKAPPLTRSDGSARASVTQARSRGVGGARGRPGGCQETALPPFCGVFVAAAGEGRRRFGDVSRPEGLLLLRR